MMLEELRRNVLDTANLLSKYGLVWMAKDGVRPRPANGICGGNTQWNALR